VNLLLVGHALVSLPQSLLFVLSSFLSGSLESFFILVDVLGCGHFGFVQRTISEEVPMLVTFPASEWDMLIVQ